MAEKKLNGTVIVTYRCNARCSMCNRYKAPSKPEEEISIETIKKLPKMYFTYIRRVIESLFQLMDSLQIELLIYVRNFLILESVFLLKVLNRQIMKSVD